MAQKEIQVEKVFRKVKLSEIDRDPKRNHARASEPDKQREQRWKDLAAAIKARGGIDNPPIVQEKKNGKFVYEMVSGYGRAGGWEVLHGLDSDILVQIITTENEQERRIINVAENTARDGMKRYDLAVNVCHLLKDGYTQAEVGRQLKITQSTVSWLKNVLEGDGEKGTYKGLTKECLDWWANAERPEDELPQEYLQKLAKQTPARQKVLMEHYLAGTTPPDEDAETVDGAAVSDDETNGSPAVAKRTKKEMEEQLERLEAKKGDDDFKGNKDKLGGQISALRWSLGYNKTLA